MSLKLHNDIILNSRHHSGKMLTDARYLPNEQKKPVILFIHGFKGFKDWGHFNLVADQMAHAGYVFVKPNLSHNGTTPEQPLDFADLEAFSENNFSIELDDIGTVIDYLFSKECIIPASEMDKDQLFLIGHSRGGGLVLLKANEDDRVKAVSTWSTVSDFSRWTKEILSEWEEKGVHYIYNSRTKQNMPIKYQIVEDLRDHPERLNIIEAVKNMDIPALIVHGTNDETVNVKDAENIHKASEQSELLIIEGANHVLGGSHPYTEGELPEHTKTAVQRGIEFFNRLKK